MADLIKHRKIGVRCYDNGGRSADRYTVLYTGRYKHLTGGIYLYVAMSENPYSPQGVGLTLEASDYIDNRGYGQKGGYSHLGKAITYDDLPDPCKRLVLAESMDLAIDFKVSGLPRRDYIEAFVNGYVACMLWSSTCDEVPLDDNYDADDIDQKVMKNLREECIDFMKDELADLKTYVSMRRAADTNYALAWSSAGHDFWLTRNSHGAGFWDRGVGAVGDRLSEAAKVYGGRDAYVGDDRKVYVSGLEH